MENKNIKCVNCENLCKEGETFCTKCRLDYWCERLDSDFRVQEESESDLYN